MNGKWLDFFDRQRKKKQKRELIFHKNISRPSKVLICKSLLNKKLQHENHHDSNMFYVHVCMCMGV